MVYLFIENNHIFVPNFSDNQKGLCYSLVRDKQCFNPSSSPITRSSCCCSLGGSSNVGWGPSCVPCPFIGTEEFNTLCRHGHGKTNGGLGKSQCSIITTRMIVCLNVHFSEELISIRSNLLNFFLVLSLLKNDV